VRRPASVSACALHARNGNGACEIWRVRSPRSERCAVWTHTRPIRYAARSSILNMAGAFRQQQWRTLLADALQQDYDALFGAVIDTPLPRPLLLATTTSTDVIAVIEAQRHAHVQVEHLFGPAYAREFIDRDLSTIETFAKNTVGRGFSRMACRAGSAA
jgi:hypothetical protein